MNAIPNLVPQTTPQDNIQRMAGIVQEVWNLPATQQNQLNLQLGRNKHKHGLAAQIPIICKGAGCPYKAACNVPDNELVTGGRCVVEIATLITRFENYCKEFQVTENDVVDLGQIKHLVDLEVKLLRCNKAMAITPELVDEIVTAVERGQKYTKHEIKPITQYEIQLLNQHSRILKDLAATREAKKLHNTHESSKQAAELVARAAKLKGGLKGFVATVPTSGFMYIDAEPADDPASLSTEPE